MSTNPFEEAFTGSVGITNSLYDLMGSEATLEYLTGSEYHETSDRTFETVKRQVIPFLAEEMSGSVRASDVPSGVAAGLAADETVFLGSVPSANLITEPKPLKCRLIFNGRRFQVVGVPPT